MPPMKAALRVTFFTAFGAAVLFAQSGLAGHWEGTVAAPNGPSQMSLDLDKNQRGDWIASLGVPQRSITGVRVGELKVEGDKVHFTVPDLPAQPNSFDLTLAAGKLSGTLAIGGGSIAVELERKGEAKVELVPASPAVSKELEGDWEGTIALPGGDSRLVVVHFQNQPDKTVSATIESPGQGPASMVLTEVKQTGSTVEFTVWRASGNYKGTLNKEGTEISGQWIQSPGADPLALTFKKK